MNEQQIMKPWWKQLWPWLIISGPAIGAIGSAITIYLALTKDVDQVVREGVIKQGLKVEQVSK